MSVEMLLGRDDAHNAILQNCRFEGLGTRAYGTEAVRSLLARHPRSVGGVPVASPGFVVIVGGGEGLCADLVDGFVTRLWRVGHDRAGGAPPPRLTVPVDLDLNQRGGALAFEGALFPDLSAEGAAAVNAFGMQLMTAPPLADRLVRARVIVLRAASEGVRTAALLRIEGRIGDRNVGFAILAVRDGGEWTTAIDMAEIDAVLATPAESTVR